MSGQMLVAAVEKLASLTHDFSDGDLEQPWNWGAHEEGVRFAYLITYQELQELAVRLRAERQAAGRGVSQAQEILGQYIAAYRDLQALLVGLTAMEYDQEPAVGEWPLRGVLGHVVNTQRPFFTLAMLGAARMRTGESGPFQLTATAMEGLTGSTDSLVAIWDSGSLAEMQNYYQELHRRILSDLAEVTDEELEVPTLWWEGQTYAVRHRFHRFTAHARQHIIQVEKTLAGIGKPPNEVRQLIRLLYSALAEVEGALLGAEETGRDAQEHLAATISQRADALRRIVDQAHQLWEAVQGNQVGQVEELLASNPELIHAQGPNGLGMLMNAIYQQRSEVVKALLSVGGALPIFEAAALGRIEAVKEALAEWSGWKDEYSKDGFTPLHLACYFGQEEVALYLIEQGANVNATARNGTRLRPVHSAAANGNLVILRALLERGAEVNIAQEGGFTPLHQAAHRGDEAMTDLFLQHGASVEARTESGQTPADIALTDGHPELAGRLAAGVAS